MAGSTVKGLIKELPAPVVPQPLNNLDGIMDVIES